MQLSLGTANFGYCYGFKNKKISLISAKNILLNVKKHKISNIDVAFDYYSFSNILPKLEINTFKFNTKIKFKNKSFNYETLEEKIRKALLILKIKNFECLMIHDFYLLSKKEIIKTSLLLKRLTQNRLIKKVGISIYSPEELVKTWAIWRPDTVQLPLNLIDKRFLETGWINKLKRNNITIEVRSVFLQGTLLSSVNNIKNEKLKNIVEKFVIWSNQHSIPRVNACLSFIKEQNIDRIIFGTENKNQLNQFMIAFKAKRCVYPNNLFQKNKYIVDPRYW
jgi:aryl-alcohol dehydrogenase-like predicted oxidoreductase